MDYKDLESEAAKQFLAAAQEVDDYRFGISADAEVLKQYEVTADAVLVLKKVRRKHLVGFPLLTNVFYLSSSTMAKLSWTRTSLRAPLLASFVPNLCLW